MKIALSVSAKEKAKGAASPYFKALVAAGARPEELVLLGPNDAARFRVEDYDGVLLAGGEDVDPARYGEKKKYDTVKVSRDRDNFEFALIDRARERGLPIFGICRGIQVINVKFGGTLFQDLEEQKSLKHRQEGGRSDATHSVVVTDPDSQLAKAFTGSRPVNSLHHQAIDREGRGLKVTARSSDDGLVEAVEAGDGYPLAAVQWHPEELVDRPEQRKIFEQFLAQCRDRAARRTAAG